MRIFSPKQRGTFKAEGVYADIYITLDPLQYWEEIGGSAQDQITKIKYNNVAVQSSVENLLFYFDDTTPKARGSNDAG